LVLKVLIDLLALKTAGRRSNGESLGLPHPCSKHRLHPKGTSTAGLEQKFVVLMTVRTFLLV
jgi:hypothetical protein